jgi:septum formation protein
MRRLPSDKGNAKTDKNDFPIILAGQHSIVTLILDLALEILIFHQRTEQTMSQERLVLASGSPRRKELMRAAGYHFEVIVPSNAAEQCGACSGTGPAALVAELAARKAADVAPHAGRCTLIAADTVAECQGQILGKPAHRQHAEQMLRLLAGREHRVYTGLCVWQLPNGEPEVRVVITTLQMDALTDEQLETYLDGHQWEGKAGAFGFQDGLDWVHLLEGSESNVVGLPMEELGRMLGGTNDSQ